jgi:hypothetical protein
MALINCPECKARISNMANACPKCGYSIRKSNIQLIEQTGKKYKLAEVAGILIVGVAAISAVLIGDKFYIFRGIGIIGFIMLLYALIGKWWHHE